MQGKQLMIHDTGCTIRGYLEIMSQTFGSFNLPSCSTSTSASANAVRSDFADAIANISVAAVECKEFKCASKSDTDAADSDMLLYFHLSQLLHQHLFFHLMCFECTRKLTEECSFHIVAAGCSRRFSIEHQPTTKANPNPNNISHKLNAWHVYAILTTLLFLFVANPKRNFHTEITKLQA